jgi:hypothetical protein
MPGTSSVRAGRMLTSDALLTCSPWTHHRRRPPRQERRAGVQLGEAGVDDGDMVSA